MASVKFSSKIEKAVLKNLRRYAKDSKQNISDIVSEAVSDYLSRAQVRRVFRKAADDVLVENSKLLKRLAR